MAMIATPLLIKALRLINRHNPPLDRGQKKRNNTSLASVGAVKESIWAAKKPCDRSLNNLEY
jgi:hypothetical protein